MKLYIFDKEKRNWTERGAFRYPSDLNKIQRSIFSGRGQLRLNDSAVSKPGHLRSRLVVRKIHHQSWRICLNFSTFQGENVWQHASCSEHQALVWHDLWKGDLNSPSIDKYSNNVSAQANEKNIRISALDEGEVYLKVDLQFLKINAGENLPDRLQY